MEDREKSVYCDSGGSDVVEEMLDHRGTTPLLDQGSDYQDLNSEILEANRRCLYELQKMSAKRNREQIEEMNEDDEGFTTVVRRPKRLLRSTSKNSEKSGKETHRSSIAEEEKHEICMTSKEILPKQFGLAKYLRSLNVKNILRISYKNPYKVLIAFGKKEDADDLLNNKEIEDKGYRCQSTKELNLSYGVIKQIDLETEEKEISETLESEYEIISVRRLKRLSDTGSWVNSETVRLCFKSPKLPSYVNIYGSRLTVEPYVFPVTQCSGCWKFGHQLRSCPRKEKVCPKCGGTHENCETNIFMCINCKGPHMALNKSCPVYIKEKELRSLMSEHNCTYRSALRTLQERSTSEEIVIENITAEDRRVRQETLNSKIIVENIVDEEEGKRDRQKRLNSSKTYKDILLTNVIVHREETESIASDDMSVETRNEQRTFQTKQKKRNGISDTTKTHNDKQLPESSEQEQDECQNYENRRSNQKRKKRRTEGLERIIQRLKDICFSDNSLEEKVKTVISWAVEELMSCFVRLLKGGDIGKLFNMFNNG